MLLPEQAWLCNCVHPVPSNNCLTFWHIFPTFTQRAFNWLLFLQLQNTCYKTYRHLLSNYPYFSVRERALIHVLHGCILSPATTALGPLVFYLCIFKNHNEFSLFPNDVSFTLLLCYEVSVPLASHFHHPCQLLPVGSCSWSSNAARYSKLHLTKGLTVLEPPTTKMITEDSILHLLCGSAPTWKTLQVAFSHLPKGI